MEKITIAIPSDANYVDGLIATAGSIAINASREVLLSFVVLDGGVPEDKYKLLRERLSSLHPHTEVIKGEIDLSAFDKFPSWKGNKMSYARFFVVHLVKDSDWAIYVDSDTIWNIDVAELWKERDDGFAVVGVHDLHAADYGSRAWFEKHGIRYIDEQYVCATTLIFNLKKLKSSDLIDRTCQFIADHQDIPSADQDAINVVFQGQIKVVGAKWMTFTADIRGKASRNPMVWHYANDVPWRIRHWFHVLNDSKMFWHRKNAQVLGISPWCSMRRYQSPAKIIGSRAIFHLVTLPVLHNFFFAFLAFCGKETYIHDLRRMNHRIAWKLR